MPTLFFSLIVGLIFIIEGMVVFTILRARKDPTGIEGVVGSVKAEFVWTLLPVLILIATVILSLEALQTRS